MIDALVTHNPAVSQSGSPRSRRNSTNVGDDDSDAGGKKGGERQDIIAMLVGAPARPEKRGSGHGALGAISERPSLSSAMGPMANVRRRLEDDHMRERYGG